jgi:hypothetical protein
MNAEPAPLLQTLGELQVYRARPETEKEEVGCTAWARFAVYFVTSGPMLPAQRK